MRADRDTNLDSESSLLGTIWNLVYGIFLFVFVYGFIATVFLACGVVFFTILGLIFDGIRYGGAIGFPYI